jgi:hypothetical protein
MSSTISTIGMFQGLVATLECATFVVTSGKPMTNRVQRFVERLSWDLLRAVGTLQFGALARSPRRTEKARDLR